VKAQAKLNTHIIFESVLMPFTKNYQNLSMLAKVGMLFSDTV